jgi:transposase-like protein
MHRLQTFVNPLGGSLQGASNHIDEEFLCVILNNLSFSSLFEIVKAGKFKEFFRILKNISTTTTASQFFFK